MYLHSSTSLPFFSPLDSCTLLRTGDGISYVSIYIPVVLPSAIIFLFLFNCGLILMGRTAEETEQNRNYADCPKKMDSKKKFRQPGSMQCVLRVEEERRAMAHLKSD